jgi:putative restriction endonuclease
MPFIHLEREIWDLRDASGAEIGPRAPESGPWLTGRGAVGRLRPQVEQLLGSRRPWPPPRGDCWTCTSRPA